MLSVYKDRSEKQQSFLRGPLIVGLLNKDKGTYTFFRIDCDVKINKRNRENRLSRASFSDLYGIQGDDISDFKDKLDKGKLKYFSDRAKDGGLELLACLLKSDLNRSAIDCYEESLSEDVAKKKMRSTALKIEVVNEIIQANNRNKKIKDILDEFKGKSGDHSLKSFLEERLKDDTELKKQILEHQLKEQKYMEDAKNAIIEATRTLQSTNVKVGRAQKDINFIGPIKNAIMV